MASWNKEQAATQRLLANNFEDARWRRTALKNAYALLSKRRFGELDAVVCLGAKRLLLTGRQNTPPPSSSWEAAWRMPSRFAYGS